MRPSCAPPATASTRASAAPSTRRSTTSALRRDPAADVDPDHDRPGIEIERRWTPLDRVGAYVPGGSAPYPSSLVMTVVPARVAGVGAGRRRVARRPRRRTRPRPARRRGPARGRRLRRRRRRPGDRRARVRAARTPASRPVDRIVGPGNAWVTAAKIEVCGEVGIDLPAGPSEGMVLAAPPADPGRVAADLITQAEHGPDSPAILVTTDAAFADAVEAAVADQLERRGAPRHPRRAPSATTAGSRSRPTLDAAIDFVNAYAPEHLSVDVEPLEPTVERLRNAGSLFVGPWAPESAGDYATGANHVLPTGGLARASGGLSVEAYGKFVQVQRIDRDGLASIRATIAHPGRGRGPPRPPRRRRDPLPRTEPDEPDAGHVQPAERARRPTAGRRPTRRSRPATASTRRPSSGSTSTPRPPRRRSRSGCWRPAGSRRRCPNIHRPTTAGWSRRPPPAMA